MIWYVVFLCGCTDCFPHAAFVDESAAILWARENSKNPEGYLIKELNGQQLAELTDE